MKRWIRAAIAAAAVTAISSPGIAQAVIEPGTVALPSGYGSVLLGMSWEEVDAALRNDTLYDYRGPADASLLSEPDQSLIETEGRSFVKRAYFQFYEKKLFSIILVMNRDRLDWYSLYTTLVAKYGKPGDFSPQAAIWTDGKVRLSLERPLTLKYVDAPTLQALQDKSGSDKAIEELLRQSFLEGL